MRTWGDARTAATARLRSAPDPHTAAPNHSPRFFVDEAALPVGVRALSHLAVDYLAGTH